MSFTIQPLNGAHASAAAELVLQHFAEDPGYTYVWGPSPNLQTLRNLYSGKMGLLIGEPDVRTVGAFDDANVLQGFVAYNPLNYKKSWGLYLQQEYRRYLRKFSGILWWPVSLFSSPPPAESAQSTMQSRQQTIGRFRHTLFPPVPEQGQIWLMHLATLPGASPEVAGRLLEVVIAEADRCKTGVEMQTLHREDTVRWAEKFGFVVVGNGTFEDADSKKVECWAMRRPAQEA